MKQGGRMNDKHKGMVAIMLFGFLVGLLLGWGVMSIPYEKDIHQLSSAICKETGRGERGDYGDKVLTCFKDKNYTKYDGIDIEVKDES